MDVVSILSKMRVAFTRFSVEVSGELTADHPKVFSRIHIRYVLHGPNIARDKVEKAVDDLTAQVKHAVTLVREAVGR